LQRILRDAAKTPLLSMRCDLLKHNNLMLKNEQRERLEAWAASDLTDLILPVFGARLGHLVAQFRPVDGSRRKTILTSIV
jgi:hypothetical protein